MNKKVTVFDIILVLLFTGCAAASLLTIHMIPSCSLIVAGFICIAFEVFYYLVAQIIYEYMFDNNRPNPSTCTLRPVISLFLLLIVFPLNFPSLFNMEYFKYTNRWF